MSGDERMRTGDPTLRLWQAFNAAGHTVDQTTQLAPGHDQVRAEPIPASHLRFLLEEADLTLLSQLPLDRAVRRVLLQIAVDFEAAVSRPFPSASSLERVLIVRSGGMHVLRPLVDKILSISAGAAVHVLTHAKDTDAVRRLWPAASIRLLAYPRLESFSEETLSELIRTVPASVQTVFYLDNAPTGLGNDLQHVERALSVRPFAEVYAFNGGGQTYEPQQFRQQHRAVDALAGELLRWYRGQSSGR